jgi:hypothetical protein
LVHFLINTTDPYQPFGSKIPIASDAKFSVALTDSSAVQDTALIPESGWIGQFLSASLGMNSGRHWTAPALVQPLLCSEAPTGFPGPIDGLCAKIVALYTPRGVNWL